MEFTKQVELSLVRTWINLNSIQIVKRHTSGVFSGVTSIASVFI